MVDEGVVDEGVVFVPPQSSLTRLKAHCKLETIATVALRTQTPEVPSPFPTMARQALIHILLQHTKAPSQPYNQAHTHTHTSRTHTQGFIKVHRIQSFKEHHPIHTQIGVTAWEQGLYPH